MEERRENPTAISSKACVPEDDLSIEVTRPESLARLLLKHSFTLIRYSLRRLSIRMTLSNLGIMAVVLAIILPRSITYILLYPIFRLVFGNLYPAYASYKAVRTKNVKEYVKWMMYWIVFALFTCAETFTDVFFSFWFPFYYEIKTILVVWLLSPATKGSSILYRRFVHPALIRREAEIDEALARATEQGYTAVLHLGTKGVNYATTVLMQTAIKGGGGLVQHLRKSYSLSDLTGEEDENRNTPDAHDETDMEVELRRREHVGRRGYSPRRTQSSSNRVEMYFSEVDVDVRQPRPREPISSLTNIRSSDDISSGYSNGEALQSHRTSQGDSLVRTSSVGARTRAKPRATTKKTPEDAGVDSDNIDLPSSINISLPTPLNLVTPEQALELLLLLSQNSNVNDYIKFDRGCPLIDNDDLGNTSQSGPKLEKNKTESRESSTEFVDSISHTDMHKEQHSDVKTVSESLTTPNNLANSTTVIEAQVQEPEIQTVRLDEPVVKVINVAANGEILSTPENPIKPSGHTEITDELCQNKFDELKQLLNDAHKAINNIVHTQEKVKEGDTQITQTEPEADTKNTNESKTETTDDLQKTTTTDAIAPSEDLFLTEIKKQDKKDPPETDGSTVNDVSQDVWITPNASESNFDSLGRAGKYHKKPAPKAPLAKSEEDLDDAESQNAVKATLVIKTGTLKTFSNTTTTKDVFFAHAADTAKSKKSKRQRTKEGFSKLLTIPKSIFHNAFHKEHKESTRGDDSNSEISDTASRSNSIASQEVLVELASKLSGSNQEINNKNDFPATVDNVDSASTQINIERKTDALDCNVTELQNNEEKIVDKDTTDTEKDIQSEYKNTIDTAKENCEGKPNDPHPEIRQMSQSPKVVKRIVSDIY